MSREKTININVPVLARVEGEGALDLRIENDRITELKLRIFEPPRFFEKFLEGRSYGDVLDIVARICGICPVAYQMTAVQALESVFNTPVDASIVALRRVMYCGEWLQSHSLHIHMLAAPDFLGVNSIIEMAKDNDEAVRRGLRLQALGNDLIALFGARSVHPVGVCVGGFSRAPDASAVEKLLQQLHAGKQDAAAVIRWVASLDLPQDAQDFVSVSLRHEQDYPLDAGRIVSDNGLDIDAEAFEQFFVEQHVPHSTALHCLLQGQPYLLGPLARLNLNLGRLPADTRALLDETGITFPSKNMFHSIIARAVEMHYVVCEAQRLLQDYQRPVQPTAAVNTAAGTGFACTEAPRGMLWHRYDMDETGHVAAAKIVPPTSQNQARIEQDLLQSLMNLGLDNTPDILRQHAEKVIRNYDPCISCATHFLKLSIDDSSRSSLAREKPKQKEKQQGEVVVIGIGSPSGSDSLGQEVIDLLRQNTSLKCDLLYLDRPGTQLLDAMPAKARVILVDAVAMGGPQGSLVKLGIEDIRAGLGRNSQDLSTHAIGLAETLQLGCSLQRLPKQLVILGLDTGGDENWRYSHKDLERLVTAVLSEVS